MSIRFISDLHLHEKRPDICRAFFKYLEEIPPGTEALYILGDFFEAWVGDDDDTPFHETIIAKLREKSNAGLPIFFMHGNRDFLVGKLFEMRTGSMIIPDPFKLHYHGQVYLLMHGDSLCTDDHEYQAFRQQMRDPDMQAMLLAKPLEERKEIARELRENSKMANSNKAEDIMDINQKELENIMTKHQVDKVIHGHTHRPAIHDFTLNNQPAKRVVLGDWDQYGWEVVLDDDIHLNQFKLYD